MAGDGKRRNGAGAEDANLWSRFTAMELETKRAELEKLIDSGMLTDRSLGNQLNELALIENELARRDGR